MPNFTIVKTPKPEQLNWAALMNQLQSLPPYRSIKRLRSQYKVKPRSFHSMASRAAKRAGITVAVMVSKDAYYITMVK